MVASDKFLTPFSILSLLTHFLERRKLAPSFIKYFYPMPPPKKANEIEMTNPDKEKSQQPHPPARKPPSDVSRPCVYASVC